MLDFLKTKVDLVELSERQLVFRSAKKFKEGSKVTVRVAIPPSSNNLAKLDVMVQSSRPHADDGFVYVSRLVEGAVGETVTGERLRGAARKELSIRVRSPQLPGFRAMTLDVSATGLQIEVDGDVAVGSIVNLTMEFDRHDLAPITTPAEVRWCRGMGDRARYRAGLMFKPNSPDLEQKLSIMGQFFESAANADLRSLLESANMLRDDNVNRRDVPLPPPPSEPVSKADQKTPLNLGAIDRAAAPAPPPPPPPPPPIPTAPPAPPPIPTAPAIPETAAVEAPAAPPPKPQVAPDPIPGDGYTDIPINATLRGYAWELEQETLVVMMRSPGGDDQPLAFPDCRTVRDFYCHDGSAVTLLRVRLQSKLLEETHQDWDVGIRKHYQFLDANLRVVLEVTSAPCCPALG
ncbi:MAG: PilZ domain-containing protein [Candidatus Eremiobacteraeota bacterium]|nr:PilZ domain-containing protein [Candidatus Eremiobacteraeota bacterium]